MEPLESRGRGLRAIAVVFLMIGVVFVGMMAVPEETAAYSTLTVEADATLDGHLYMNGTVFPPADGPTVNSTSAEITSGTAYSPGTGMYYLFRAFISFDTSAIPAGATIISATLEAEANSFSGSVTSYLYSADYGASLDVTDWGAADSFQGLFWSTTTLPFTWEASIGVDVRSVSPGGLSQYVIQSSDESYTGSKYVSFASSDNLYYSPPTLILTYVVLGAPISIELDSGDWLNSTAYPDIQDWNLTYDLHCYELDTVPSSKNMTITKQDANWTLASMSPGCNYTDTDTYLRLEDVYDSICYRVWFYVPKSNPYTSVHLSLYNSFTGEGFFWEQMKVMICDGLTWDNTTAEGVARADFKVEPNQNYTIRILDYFDNMLVDYPFVANAQDMYLSIPVPYYSWQVFNMNEMPVLMKIYWNNSGAPWEFFVGPQWIIERNLKGGNYTFMVTFYDTDGIAGETVSYNRVVPNAGLNASFIMIEGTTLSEIVSDVEGIQAMQAILTMLVTPSTVLIYEDLPLAPVVMKVLALEDGLVIDPYLILEATTYQNDTGTEEVNLTLEQVHPGTYGYTYYVLSDVISFSGTYVTTIYINDTDGNNLYYSNVLPATVMLDGQEVQIWANNNFSVSRASTWREISEYTITYYQTQHKWTTTLNLNNSHILDFYEPYWYIAFPEDAIVDQETVTLYDLDNDVYLSQRTNFDVTAGGVHVTLTQLNASMERNFLLTFWDSNSTTGIGAPNLIAEAYTQSTLNGVPMKYTSVQWMNPHSVEYVGEIYITLNFTYGDCLVPSSITIIDETTGTEIPNSRYVYTGRTIIILTDGVGTVEVGGARSYGVYFTLDVGLTTDEGTDFFFGPIVINGQSWYLGTYAVSIFILLLIVLWAMTAWVWWSDSRATVTMVLLSSSITVIGFYLSQFM